MRYTFIILAIILTGCVSGTDHSFADKPCQPGERYKSSQDMVRCDSIAFTRETQLSKYDLFQIY